MSITTVSIQGTVHDVYGSIAELSAYVAATLLPTGVTFTSDNTRQLQLLVTGSRLFDRLVWKGVPNDLVTPQPLAWARKGLSDRNGEALDGTSTPQDIFDGFFELCVALKHEGTLNIITSEANAGNGNTRRTRTLNRVEGAVTEEIENEFFVPLIGTRSGALRLPLATHEFVLPYLGSATVVTGIVSGNTGTSSFDEDTVRFGFVVRGLLFR